MTSFNTTRIWACLASTLILLSSAAWASDEPAVGADARSASEEDGSRRGTAAKEVDASSSKGLASILIEGASRNATCSIDGNAVMIPQTEPSNRELVIKAGRHVIEVREGEEVVLREEVALKPGETKTLRVTRAKAE